MAVQDQSFLEGVMSRGGLPGTEAALVATVHVLETLSGHLDGVDQDQMAVAVPPCVRDAIRWDAAHELRTDETSLEQEMARRASCPPERARDLIQAVLSEMDVTAPAVVDMLKHRLPDDAAPLFAAPNETPSEAGPRPLTADELERTLHSLDGWHGTTERITREVVIPREQRDSVFHEVEAAATELSHHAEITEDDDGGVVFALGTRSTVSELDLQLARRIDAAVRDAGPCE